MLVTVLGIGIGLYVIDRLGLWLEAKGWLYYRKYKAPSGFITSTLLEMQNIVNPSVRHIIEIKQSVKVPKLEETDNRADLNT